MPTTSIPSLNVLTKANVIAKLVNANAILTMTVLLAKGQFVPTDAAMLVSVTQSPNSPVKLAASIQLHGMLTKKLDVFVILDDEALIALLVCLLSILNSLP